MYTCTKIQAKIDIRGAVHMYTCTHVHVGVIQNLVDFLYKIIYNLL